MCAQWLSPVRLFVTPWTVASGSSVHGILQARILEWVAMSSSRGSSIPRDWSWVSFIAGRFFTTELPAMDYNSPTGLWISSPFYKWRTNIFSNLCKLTQLLSRDRTWTQAAPKQDVWLRITYAVMLPIALPTSKERRGRKHPLTFNLVSDLLLGLRGLPSSLCPSHRSRCLFLLQWWVQSGMLTSLTPECNKNLQ